MDAGGSLPENDSRRQDSNTGANMRERRKDTDRRANDCRQDQLYRCNRRIRPDRRLNNIVTEWIPMEHILLHPTTRLIFSRK